MVKKMTKKQEMTPFHTVFEHIKNCVFRSYTAVTFYLCYLLFFNTTLVLAGCPGRKVLS